MAWGRWCGVQLYDEKKEWGLYRGEKEGRGREREDREKETRLKCCNMRDVGREWGKMKGRFARFK